MSHKEFIKIVQEGRDRNMKRLLHGMEIDKITGVARGRLRLYRITQKINPENNTRI